MARRKVIRVRIKGKLMTLREVSEKYHISPELLRYRYKHKMRGDELLCGRKDSKSKDEVEYMKSQIKDEEKEREKSEKSDFEPIPTKCESGIWRGKKEKIETMALWWNASKTFTWSVLVRCHL